RPVDHEASQRAVEIVDHSLDIGGNIDGHYRMETCLTEVSIEKAARDDVLLDLARSLVDSQNFGIAVEPFDATLGGVAIPPVDLYGFVRYRHRRLARGVFRHARGLAVVLAGIRPPRRIPRQQPRRLRVRLHIGKFVSDGLNVADRSAELLAFGRVVEGFVEGVL